ncbi:hypothetical protein niasHT_017381 [Heterodera trifolii]|uniref:Nuclear receptor domain-containing protein n=1 Tax=Heterodera trifolii TaxID=157864 RepID=A0ABD2L7H1_9BILA
MTTANCRPQFQMFPPPFRARSVQNRPMALSFSVPSCRACGSFFRRSVLDKRKYLCHKENNCAIINTGMRNSCRACRLKRCFGVGMDISQKRSKKPGGHQENIANFKSANLAKNMCPQTIDCSSLSAAV